MSSETLNSGCYGSENNCSRALMGICKRFVVKKVAFPPFSPPPSFDFMAQQKDASASL